MTGVTTGRRTRPGVWLVITAVIAMLSVTSSAPVHACDQILDVIYLTTFDVSIEADAEEYEVGDTVTVDVDVLRPAEEDPAGLGQPTPAPEQVEAEDVRVAVSLKFPKGLLFNWSITDENGHAEVEIELDDRITPGAAKAAAYAWVSYPAGCTRIDETGYIEIEDFVTAHPQGS